LTKYDRERLVHGCQGDAAGVESSSREQDVTADEEQKEPEEQV